MLPQQYRLTRKKDFEILFKDGRFVGADVLIMKYWQIDAEAYPRRAFQQSTDLLIGFVVGLKVSKKAVERNRLKRQMREVVRLLLQAQKIKPGYLIAFVAKKEMLGKEYADIEQDILFVLKRARLLVS